MCAAQQLSWDYAGYRGGGNVADLLRSQTGRPAIVVGSGEGVFREIEACEDSRFYGNALVFAANDVGVFLSRVDHLVSLHANNLPHWAALRADKHARDSFKTHSFTEADFIWQELEPMFSLSGYFAMQVAYLMGCEPIILCGCPGDGTKRFFDSKPREDFDYQVKNARTMIESEMARLPEFKSKVRSMSGWTREFFGGP